MEPHAVPSHLIPLWFGVHCRVSKPAVTSLHRSSRPRRWLATNRRHPAAMKSLLLAAALAAVALPAIAQPAPRKTATSSSDGPDCAAMGALPATWDGQAYAIDGATLAGVGLKPHVRIWGIQAPELRDTRAESVAGMRARAALEDLLAQS